MASPIIVAAMAANRVIGNSETNDLPWERQADDMDFFRNITMHNSVLMGHKTFMSLRAIPLPNRANYVMSSVPMGHRSQVQYIRDFENVVSWMQYEGLDNFYVIGGRTMYDLFLPHVNRMYLTKFNFESEGDIMFPDFDESEWNITMIRELENGRVYQYDRITPVDQSHWNEPEQDDDEYYDDEDDF